MNARDRFSAPADIVVSDATAITGDGQDQTSKLVNRRRRERVDLRVTGELKVTAPGTGVVNKGSVLGGVSRIKLRSNGKPFIDMDARSAQKLAEFFAGGPLPAVRALNANNQDSILSEAFSLFCASPRSINPSETKYLDVQGEENPVLDVSMVPLRGVNVPGIVTGAAATLPNLKCTIRDVFDEDRQIIPDYRIYGADEILIPVTQKVTTLRIDVKPPRRIRAILMQLDQDQSHGIDTLGRLVNFITLRTDAGTPILDHIPWKDFVESQAQDFEGLGPDYAYAIFDFQRAGRNSSWLNPADETGLRYEMDVDPTGLSNAQLRLTLVEYEQIAGVTADTTAHQRALAAGKTAGPTTPKS